MLKVKKKTKLENNFLVCVYIFFISCHLKIGMTHYITY